MKNLISSDSLPFDIRAEVLARLLAKRHNLNIEQLLLRPQNYFQRWARKDVTEISEGYSIQLNKEVLWLDISRESLFDTLPESIFLHPDDDYPDYVDRVKKLSEQEKDARKFLLPFEQLFYWLRIENEEREYTAETKLETWWQNLLADAYISKTDSLLDDEQQAILTQMLPYLSDIVGNWALTEQWLSIFMKTPIKLVEIPPPQYSLPEDVQKRMGEGFLGQDFVIGNCFSDGIPALKITIDNLTPDALQDYLMEGRNRKILEQELLSLLLPIETPYKIELGIENDQYEFLLADRKGSAILGFTSSLIGY
jgi:hypothetical protein